MVVLSITVFSYSDFLFFPNVFGIAGLSIGAFLLGLLYLYTLLIITPQAPPLALYPFKYNVGILLTLVGLPYSKWFEHTTWLFPNLKSFLLQENVHFGYNITSDVHFQNCNSRLPLKAEICGLITFLYISEYYYKHQRHIYH